MIKISRMQPCHIDSVYQIELSSFAIPWTKGEFYRELEENKHAIYFVAINCINDTHDLNDDYNNQDILGYAGMWHVINEGHITNVAVREDVRKQGVGALLVNALIAEGKKLHMIGLTLEVRISNLKAQRLYTRYGFKPEGIRKNYYSDTREDAIIMWNYFGDSDES